MDYWEELSQNQLAELFPFLGKFQQILEQQIHYFVANIVLNNLCFVINVIFR